MTLNHKPPDQVDLPSRLCTERLLDLSRTQTSVYTSKNPDVLVHDGQRLAQTVSLEVEIGRRRCSGICVAMQPSDPEFKGFAKISE